MQNENVKNGQILSVRSSEEAVRLANDYFKQISFEETQSMLDESLHAFLKGPDLSLKNIRDRIYHFDQLLLLLENLSNLRPSTDDDTK